MRPGDRGGDRERGRQARDLQALLPHLPQTRDACSPPTPRRSRSPAWPRPPTGPSAFIGMHFMNPVPVMKLVEMIRGIATDDETFETAVSLRHQARQDHRRRRGFPGLHRQPHPAADDQRGDLHALRGRRLGGGDRHRHAAGRQPSDGAAASSPTSSAWTPAWRSCRCCTTAWPIPNTGPARCW